MYKFPPAKLGITIFQNVLVDTNETCVEYLYILIGLENISLDFSALYIPYVFASTLKDPNILNLYNYNLTGDKWLKS